MARHVLLGGDSITAGYPHGTGYRLRLYQAMGADTAWYGSQTTMWDSATNSYKPQPGTLLRHEGHGGITIDGWDAHAHEWVNRTDFDDVVLVLGMNDVGHVSVDQYVASLKKLVEDVRTYAPKAQVTVFAPLPAVGFTQKADQIAGKLADRENGVSTWLAHLATGPAPRLVYPERYRAAFDRRPSDVVESDGTHPTLYGYELLADDVTAALGGKVLPPEVPRPLVLSTPAGKPQAPAADQDEENLVYLSSLDGVEGPLSWSAGSHGETYLGDQEGRSILLTLNPYETALFERQVRRWQPLAKKYGEQFDVPWNWVLGVIAAESWGDPTAKNAESPPGLGLMQVTAPELKVGHTDQEFLDDPDLNVATGTRLLGKLAAKIGRRLPEVASGYNAGVSPDGFPHPSDDPLWRMRNSRGYVGRVVAASNTALGFSPGQSAPAPKEATPSSSSGGGLGGLLALSLLGLGLLKMRAR